MGISLLGNSELQIMSVKVSYRSMSLLLTLDLSVPMTINCHKRGGIQGILSGFNLSVYSGGRYYLNWVHAKLNK